MSKVAALIGVGALAIALTAAQVGWAASTVTSTVTKDLSVSDATALKLGAENGDITVRAYSGDTLAVEVWMQAKAPSRAGAQRLLEAIRVTTEVSSSLDQLIVRQPRTGFGQGTQVRVTVKVPKGWAGGLDMATVNGRASAAGLKGDARLSTENGALQVSDWSGCLDMRTTNGEVVATRVDITGRSEMVAVNGAVTASLTSAPSGDITMHTTNGALSLALPGLSKVSLDAGTVNGRVTVSGLGAAITSHGDVSADLNGGGVKATLRTTNGSIDVRGN